MMERSKIIYGFIWRLLQSAGNQAVSFIISIVLARLLMPDDYGLISMISIFTNLAMVFINTGFSSSIIQKDDLSEIDLDTIFISGSICALVLYLILFFIAPWVSEFYKEPQLTLLLRIQGLSVLLAASYSVQQSIVNRDLQFKKSFAIGMTATIAQGIIGIFMAFYGFGGWSLVISSLVFSGTSSILFWSLVRWKPKFRFSRDSFSSVFVFSINILFDELLGSIYNNIRSLVIGKQYNSASLAFYEKGNQVPAFVMLLVDGSMSAVLFPSLSRYQGDWESGLPLLRRSLQISMYVCTPMMIGLIAVAKPLVSVLLTDKWLPCVEYLQMSSIICMLWPLSAKLSGLKALGRSNIVLKLSFIDIIMSFIILLLTFRISVKAMIMGYIVVALITHTIEMIVCSKFLNYKIADQIGDVLSSFILSGFMFIGCLSISHLNIPPLFLLILQIILGILIYIVLSILTKNKSFFVLYKLLTNVLKGKNT